MRNIGFHASLEDIEETRFVVDKQTSKRLDECFESYELTEQVKINLLIDERDRLKNLLIRNEEEYSVLNSEYLELRAEFKSLFSESKKTNSSMIFYCHLSKLLGLFLAIVVFLLVTMILNH